MAESLCGAHLKPPVDVSVGLYAQFEDGSEELIESTLVTVSHSRSEKERFQVNYHGKVKIPHKARLRLKLQASPGFYYNVKDAYLTIERLATS